MSRRILCCDPSSPTGGPRRRKGEANNGAGVLEVLCKALADRTRLRLLNLMRDQEVCVCYFVEVLGSSQPKVSRHLAYLRRAGLVSARRQGLWMHYRIVQPVYAGAARLLASVQEGLRNDPDMQRDLARFRQACCAPEKFVKLQPAPLPVKLKKGKASGSQPD